MAEVPSMENRDRITSRSDSARDCVVRERLKNRVAEWQDYVDADSTRSTWTHIESMVSTNGHSPTVEEHIEPVESADPGMEWIPPNEIEWLPPGRIALQPPRLQRWPSPVRTRTRLMDLAIIFTMSLLALAICLYVFYSPD